MIATVVAEEFGVLLDAGVERGEDDGMIFFRILRRLRRRLTWRPRMRSEPPDPSCNGSVCFNFLDPWINQRYAIPYPTLPSSKAETSLSDSLLLSVALGIFLYVLNHNLHF